MKNAVVVGATTHVGFALCQKLINHEVEVTGFEWTDKMDERAHEMLMEIGRNAFFQLQLNQPLEKSVDVAFYFIDRMERLDESNEAAYLSFAEKANKLVLVSSYENHRKNVDLRNVLKKKQNATNCLSIYLPMVIGPWQGEEEAVHRRLQEELDEKEHQPISIQAADVLYVEDVAKAIFDLSINEVGEKEVCFKNEHPEALKELMNELNLTLLKDVNQNSEWERVKEYTVKQSMTMKESLQEQRNQMRQKLKLD